MRKIFKRMKIWAVVICILLTPTLSVLGAELSFSAKEQEVHYLEEASTYSDSLTIDTYNASIYRAERYLDTNSIGYKDITFWMENISMPSDTLVECGKENYGFIGLVTAWKAINIAVSPSQIAEGMLDQIGYYEAIIFSIFI